MKNISVSVVMPVFNAERYLAEAVESVLSQTLEDFELLIFDDGSSDYSLTILDTYARREKRIRLFAKPHKGYVAWLNEGIKLARGQFIARMDADDVSLPNRFARQVEHLRNNPKCVAVGCHLMMVDPDGSKLGDVYYEVDHERIEANLLSGGLDVLCHPASMMRRSALFEVAGYQQRYETIEDFALWLHLTEKGQLANVPEILFKYRKHHKSVSAIEFERQKTSADLIINEARERRGLAPLTRRISAAYIQPRSNLERHLEWAMIAAASGHRKTALKHAFYGLVMGPRSLAVWTVLMRCLTPNGLISALRPFLLPFRPTWNAPP